MEKLNFLKLRGEFATFPQKLQIYAISLPKPAVSNGSIVALNWTILNSGVMYISKQFVYISYTRHLLIWILWKNFMKIYLLQEVSHADDMLAFLRMVLSVNNPVLLARHFQYKVKVFLKEIILHGPLRKQNVMLYI